MDVIDILGGLMGSKSKGAGAGAKILRDILLGGKKETPAGESRPSPFPKSSPAPTSKPSRSSRPPTGDDLERQARELEDLLITAGDRQAKRPQASPAPRPSQPAPQFQPPSAPARPSVTPSRPSTAPTRPGIPPSSPARFEPPRPAESQNEQALVLVRAMVSAAKADGQISQQEQQQILEQIGDTSREAIEFLRAEFARPLDLRELVWSVPTGMEQQVYMVSLLAIDLDTAREADYLRELAHGLRLRPEVCDQIHERCGVPTLR